MRAVTHVHSRIYHLNRYAGIRNLREIVFPSVAVHGPIRPPFDRANVLPVTRKSGEVQVLPMTSIVIRVLLRLWYADTHAKRNYPPLSIIDYLRRCPPPGDPGEGELRRNFNRFIAVIPLFLRKIQGDQLFRPAPVLLRYEGEEELREVQGGVGHAVRKQSQQKQPLVSAKVTDVRQDIVEGFQL